MKPRALVGLALLGTLAGAAGCHVQVDKGRNGEDKSVRIETPLGGLHVQSDQTTAADLGLPAYPGATLTGDNQGDKSADVQMGFGNWQLHVDVVTYQTAAPQSKVIAFYKNALGRFGTVISCQGDKAVGTPAATPEGLTCSKDHGSNVNVNGVNVDDQNNFTLRAGSKHHQHIFVLKSSGEGTRFSLVELELPVSMTENGQSSD